MGIETIVTQPKGEIKVETAFFSHQICNPLKSLKVRSWLIQNFRELKH